MAQSYLRHPSIERLPVILEELHRGSLRIPPFQRDFEWDGEQRLALCSSVRMGLPTGAIMVWRTLRALNAEDPIGPYPLPQPRTPASQYLLDGRQRMTTLYAALAPSFWTSAGLTPPELTGSNRNAPDGTPWGIMCDLDSNSDDASGFVYEDAPSQGNFPFDKRTLLPLSVLFDDNAYDEWRGRNKLSREQTNRARALRSAFNDYLIPVVPLATDNISVVTTSVKRVNSGGTQMGDAEMIRALVWSPQFDLRDRIDAIQEELRPRGWGGLPDEALLKVIAAISALDPAEVEAEELARKIQADPELVQKAGQCILSAATLLDSGLGIAGPGALPYTQVLVFVVRAMHQAGGSLSREQDANLTGWAAEVCLDARFGGAPPHMIRADWRALANRLGLPDAAPPRARDQKRSQADECWVFSMAWARSRGAALVLAAQRPRDAEDKLFPSPHELVARGTDNLGMLLADGAEGLPASFRKQAATDRRLKVALRSPANRVVCPPEELPRLRGALLRPDCPEALRRSHLIEPEAHDALLSGNLEGFFEFRRTAIIAAEDRWVQDRGGKVEILREPRTYAEG
jgi:Protein of unknown function DUF262